MKKSRKRPKTHKIQHLGGSTALSGYQTSFPLTYSASPSTPSASHLYSQPTPKISTRLLHAITYIQPKLTLFPFHLHLKTPFLSLSLSAPWEQSFSARKLLLFVIFAGHLRRCQH
ncbi:hypothetical protein PRUPE_4G249000 [Prunus persica]|uniref:Uncharacterized protein n=1 Tax=Prunus persica TaxID=3760 RepID=M5WPL4_PRUPE|nr:hypothetical protein PRUPE_4G249000 [Prunus persica]